MRQQKISHRKNSLSKNRKRISACTIAVEPLEIRQLMSSVAQTQSASFGPQSTSFTNKTLTPLIAQFDNKGGALILDSTEVIASSNVTSTLSGSITNNSSFQIATFAASTINASTSVSGPGLSNVSNSAATLLSYRATISPRTTLTIPSQQQTVSATADVLYTASSDLAQFIGTGTLTYLTSESASTSSSLTGSSNVSNNSSVRTTGGATVTVVYNYHTAPVVVTTVAAMSNGGVAGATLLSDVASVSGGYNVGGSIAFTLTKPDGSTISIGSVPVNGDGNYNSPTYTADQVGTYTWHATYSGDGTNASATENGANESVTTIKSSPAIATMASSQTSVVGSALLSDTATVSGGYNVGGSISFTLTKPDGSTVSVGSVNVNGDGTYPSPSSVLADEVGTYTWHASYSGDSLNNGAIDNGDNESITTTKASPVIVTIAQPSSSADAGAVLSDEAILSGGYNVSGGTISFSVQKPDGSIVNVGSVSVSGDGMYNSGTITADQVGTYTWTASYSGDSLNNGAIDDGSNEATTASKASPAISTQARESGNVAGSAILRDAAILTGGYNVGGTITFTLTQPDGSTISIGSVNVNGDATYDSPTFVATEVGTYTWHASYSGDSLNNGAIDDGTNESVSTVKASPSINTLANESSNIVGDAVLSDSAVVSGGYNVSGTVDFTVSLPDGSILSFGSVNVSGDGTYYSPTLLATEVGTYTFHASYSGNSLNNGAIDDGTNESVSVVKSSPSISTQASQSGGLTGATLNDSALVTGGYNVGGSITFTLKQPDGSVVNVGSVNVNGDGTYFSPSVVANQAGTYLWTASYSGDSLNNTAVDNGNNESATFYAPVTIGNFVWNDSNANGIQDSGEAGIGGVTLTLTGTDYTGASVTDHTASNSNGGYLFTEAPGTYTVTVDSSNSTGALAGYSASPTQQGIDSSVDSNPNPSGTSPATLTSGGSDTSVDFGFYQPVTIGNFVWADTNANGIQDSGETGINGVTLTLTGTNGSGQSVTDHATTSGNGAYQFTEVPGTYTVTVDASNFSGGGALAGYTASATNQGSNTAIDTNTNPSGTTPGTLPGGSSDQTIDFGYYKPVTIGDFVWNDSNENGVQDSGEQGIVGVTVTLTGTNGLGQSVTDTTTTDSTGHYLFTEAPGTYTISVVTPAGYTPTVTGKGMTSTDSNANPSGTTPGMLPSGSSDTTVDFGFYKPVTIGNFVWADTNANGIQNTSELGINGVTLTLTGTNGAGQSVTDHATTSGNGAYLFTEAPGTYTVTVDASNFSAGGALAGYTAAPTLQGSDRTVDSNLSPSGTSPSTLPGGNGDLSIDFGYYKPVTIGDFVWNDTNGNGIQNAGEAGIAGVTLTLTGTNGSGQTVTDHATTTSSGGYLFTEVPGTYTVTVDASNFAPGGALIGYTPSQTLQGGNTATDSNANPSGTAPGTLSSGSSDVSVDFGYYKPVTIGNFVWNDSNANGIQDTSELGINGVTLTLTGTNGAGQTVTDHTTTSGNGAYQFTEAPGTYTITVDASNFSSGGALAGYTPSATNQGGNTAIDSNTNPSGTAPGTLAGGSSDQTVDFGYYQNVTIGNFVWNDTNANGIQDTSELGINGVTLTLTGTNGAGQNVTDHVTTSGNGGYLFTEAPGTYMVSVDASNFASGGALAGYNASPTLQGTNRAVDSNASPSSTNPGTLPGGSSDLTVDYGYYKPVTVGNFVWNDSNANGIQDSSEAGINGVTLTLTGTSSTGVSITDHATTSGNGAYLFTELPGTYTVTVDASNFATGGALAGYNVSATLQGSNRAVDSNANPSGTSPGTLLGGSNDLSIDFGYYKNVTIGDFVWNDSNGSGIQDSGELGINGVTLTLTGTNGLGQSVTDHATTSGNGGYLFTETPGTYTVTVDSSNFSTGGALVGYQATATLQGTNRAVDSNVSPSGTTPGSLPGGSSDLTIDFGYGKPSINIVKTADVAQVAMGGTAGFTVKITNDGAITDTAVSLTDALPAGSGGDINWTIDTSGSGLGAGTNPADFVITGSVGNQSLGLSSYFLTTLGDKLAPGQSILVHITSPTNTLDAEGGIAPPANSFDPTGTAAMGIVSLGTAGNYAALGLNGTKINNSLVTIYGNEGVSQNGSLTNQAPSSVIGNVYQYASGEYSGPGAVGGSVITNGSLLSQNDTDALAASSTAAALTATQTFGSITTNTVINGNGGLNVIKINGNITLGGSNSLILNGTASDVFIIDITGTITINGSSQLGIAGGVTPNHVLYNLTATSGTISAQVGNVIDGTILAPHQSYSLDGTYYGELIIGGSTFNLLSGAKIFAGTKLLNTATVTATGLGPKSSTAQTDITTDPNTISGIAFCDANLNGVYDTGETLEAGSVVSLIYNGTVIQTATTDANGAYSFDNVGPGTYTVQLTTPTSGDAAEVSHGNVTVFSSYTVSVTSDVVSSGNNFAEVDYGSVSGTVFDDTDLNGTMNGGDAGLPGVTITLTGTPYFSSTPISPISVTTDASGNYTIPNVLPGTYTLTETQPTGYGQGKDTAGNLGGNTSVQDVISNISLPGCNNVASGYLFAEKGVLAGRTGTIGWWANSNGQKQITLLGATSTSLANSLAQNFPNLFGSKAPAWNVNSTVGTNLTNRSASDVAAYFLSLFKVTGTKVYAQVLATALSEYTQTTQYNSTAAGQAWATQHGFILTSLSDSTNLANSMWNVGANGEPFSVADNTSLSVGNILLAANTYAVNGVLWAKSQTIGGVSYTSATLQTEANVVFNAINNAGDMTV